jgi:hypothetical protein
MSYAVFNKDRNRLLTSFGGRSTWETIDQAREVRDSDFGGGSHLKIVELEVIE